MSMDCPDLWGVWKKLDRLFSKELPSSDLGPELQSETLEQQRILWDSIQALPEQHREMIVLRYMLGWRVKDIAKQLDINENTVSVNLRRILARIRRDWPKN